MISVLRAFVLGKFKKSNVTLNDSLGIKLALDIQTELVLKLGKAQEEVTSSFDQVLPVFTRSVLGHFLEHKVEQLLENFHALEVIDDPNVLAQVEDHPSPCQFDDPVLLYLRETGQNGF